jgi:DNA topoisomerase-1
LYELIWQRAVASQMAAAVYDVRQAVMESVEPVEGKTLRFGAKGERLKFAGWLSLTGGDAADEGEYEGRDNPVPPLQSGDRLCAKDAKLLEKKTEPPRRYTQAGLVRALERLGIGRPSTYAAIMEGLVKRGYVEIKAKMMHPTEIGKAVVDALKPAFSFLAYEFTAKMEDKLDEIAQGRLKYLDVVAETHAILEQEISALPGASRRAFGPKAEIDESAPKHDCPQCGKPLRRINGKNGWFWGCSGFKEGCKLTLPDRAGEPVPRSQDGRSE